MNAMILQRLLVLFLVLAGPCAWARGAEVRILAPAPGATLTAKGANTLSYEAETGSDKGSHVHVYIDGQEIGSLHRLKGDYTLKGLVPGGREICVGIANKAHVPTGVGSCIEVTVE